MQESTVQKLFDLRAKTALVTGATGHLGRAIACGLAEAGANVLVTSRDQERAITLAAELPTTSGSRHYGLALDHLNEESLADSFGAAAAMIGSIDILVNNGHDACKSDLTNCTAEEFNRQMTNATGYFLLARLVRDHAVSLQQPASIIMLGSMYGLVASYPEVYEGVSVASPVAYHTLKGGILQMTRHLAVYWARDRVRVNALSPGPFPSAAVAAQMVDRIKAKSPMQRIGQPHELKGAVVFLASDASSYVTGHNLVVDGGWTAW